MAYLLTDLVVKFNLIFYNRNVRYKMIFEKYKGSGFQLIKDWIYCHICNKFTTLYTTITLPGDTHECDVCWNCVECNTYIEYNANRYYISEIAPRDYKSANYHNRHKNAFIKFE